MQSRVALPKEHEEAPPQFRHHAEDPFPLLEQDGASVRLIAGSLYGASTPVKTFSDMFYADVTLAPNASLQVPPEYEERAVYVVDGAIQIGNDSFGSGRLVVLKPGGPILLTCLASARVMLLGGERMDGPRYL